MSRRGAATTVAIDVLQVPREFSGVGRQALSLAAELSELPPELELEVRCAADVRPLLEAAFPPGTRFRTAIRSSRPRWRRLLHQQLIAPAADSRETLLVCLGDQGPVWGRARVLLVVNDLRRLEQPLTSGLGEGLFYRLLVPLAARRAARIVTISEFSRERIERLLAPAALVRVVAHHPPPCPRPEGSGGGPFLSVGALRSYKGADTVIDALALLAGDVRPRVLFAGPTEGRAAELRDVARAGGVGAAIEIAGWLDDAALEEAYGAAVATVNASRYEGYGLAVAESLARGLPTIASDIPAHREIGGDAVLYFAAGNPSSLAECMARVAASAELRARLASAARARSLELARGGLPSWREVILEAAGSD